MKRALNIRLFAHSLVSDWNHGNAHFLRGLARALGQMGHTVRCLEELGSWSLSNLIKQEEERSIHSIDQFRDTYRELDVRFYRKDEGLQTYLRQELRGVDVVIINEWSDPLVVNTILAMKDKFGFIALLHDSHHRAYSRANEILRFHLHLFDGVLAFGESIRRIYADGFGMRRAWTFHEAAAIDVFYPMERPHTADILWIGNWGDEERADELKEFLIGPAASLAPAKKTVAYGVRYPQDAICALEAAQIEYRGYLPNLQAPAAYAETAVALHIPRRPYSNGLGGVPTIRVFEALACGAALVCSPWQDLEGLFHPGEDFLCVNNGDEMRETVEFLLRDDRARSQIAANGLKTIRSRHTCMHRAQQLNEIFEEIVP